MEVRTQDPDGPNTEAAHHVCGTVTLPGALENL